LAAHKHHDKKDGDAPAGPELVTPAAQSTEATPATEAGANDQLQKLLAEKQDLMNTLVRRQADFENYRKRVEKERQSDRHRGVELLIEKILPVLDAFENALAADAAGATDEYRKGFELIYRQLIDTLTKQGLKRIDATGKEFDPNFHHAIQSVETTERPEGHVLGELQPGYIFHDRVLRPAMVRVATAPAGESAAEIKRRN
jgi:molecular chaperone GrpE